MSLIAKTNFDEKEIIELAGDIASVNVCESILQSVNEHTDMPPIPNEKLHNTQKDNGEDKMGNEEESAPSTANAPTYQPDDRDEKAHNQENIQDFDPCMPPGVQLPVSVKHASLSDQTELLRYHYRLNHLSFNKLK